MNDWKKLPHPVKVTLTPDSAKNTLDEWDDGFDRRKSIHVKALMERIRNQLSNMEN